MEPGTARFETFSDGVFAIAATLLVLEFKAVPGKGLGDELLHLWPSYLAYVTSFLCIVRSVRPSSETVWWWFIQMIPMVKKLVT